MRARLEPNHALAMALEMRARLEPNHALAMALVVWV
jgi:hypothetical protein